MTTEVTRLESPDVLAYELAIAAPPQVVWRFWVDPAWIVRWMGDIATLDPRPGGLFRLEYRSGDIARGAYLEVDEPRRLVLSWGWEAEGDPTPPGASRIEVELDPIEDGAGTRLTLRHAGLPAPSRESHHEGWNHFLARLAEAVRTPDQGA
jgi:uncharacterized protein YndB with AHSA1/START domain